MSDLKIAVVLGSVRQGRNGAAVAKWVLDQAADRGARYELVDLAEYPLPFFEEPMSPAYAPPTGEAVSAWGELVSGYDAFVFVTPEYNHSTSAVLKNAIDSTYWGWTNKAAGFVGYGSVGGTRAIEHLRGIATEVQLAHVRQSLAFTFENDFEDHRTFRPGSMHAGHAQAMFDQLETWARAMRSVREEQLTRA